MAAVERRRLRTCAVNSHYQDASFTTFLDLLFSSSSTWSVDVQCQSILASPPPSAQSVSSQRWVYTARNAAGRHFNAGQSIHINCFSLNDHLTCFACFFLFAVFIFLNGQFDIECRDMWNIWTSGRDVTWLTLTIDLSCPLALDAASYITLLCCSAQIWSFLVSSPQSY